MSTEEMCAVIIVIVDPFLLLSSEMEYTHLKSKYLSYSKSYSDMDFSFCFLFFRILGIHIHNIYFYVLSSAFTFKYPIKFVLCQIKDALDARIFFSTKRIKELR